MGEILYFKNSEDRKYAEYLITKQWPESSFIVMRTDDEKILKEEKVHFGSWDIYPDIQKIYHKNDLIQITEKEWAVFEFLMDGIGCIFSAQEIAYALDTWEEFVKIQLENLIKKLGNGNKVPIKKNRTGYYFDEVLD